jgi:ribosomal protein L16/L10AE
MRLKEGQIIISVYVNEANVPLARQALQKANFKLPKNCRILVTKTVKKD